MGLEDIDEITNPGFRINTGDFPAYKKPMPWFSKNASWLITLAVLFAGSIAAFVVVRENSSRALDLGKENKASITTVDGRLRDKEKSDARLQSDVEHIKIDVQKLDKKLDTNTLMLLREIRRNRRR